MRVVRTVAVRLVGYATAVLAAIRERHRERMTRDPAYRTAIATGLSALLLTITPQPAVAAALAVLVSEHLGASHAASKQHAYGYEEDGYEVNDTSHAWSSMPSSRPSQRGWESLQD